MIKHGNIFITPKVIRRVINTLELYGSKGYLTLLEEAGLYPLWINITSRERIKRDSGVRLTSPLQDLADNILLKYLKKSLTTGELPRNHH